MSCWYFFGRFNQFCFQIYDQLDGSLASEENLQTVRKHGLHQSNGTYVKLGAIPLICFSQTEKLKPGIESFIILGFSGLLNKLYCQQLAFHRKILIDFSEIP